MSEARDKTISAYFAMLRQEVKAEVRTAIQHEMRDTIRDIVDEEVTRRIDPLADAIGRVNDMRTGGTGLAGELARQNTKLEQIFRLRYVGTGVFLTLSFTGALIWLGLKHTVTQWFAGH